MGPAVGPAAVPKGKDLEIMTEPSKTDLALAKLIKAADQDMVKLMKLLEASTKDLNKGTADRAKAERAIKEILKYLGKYKAITTVKPNVLEQLLPQVRAGVLRTDAAYSTLFKNLDKLQRAKKLSGLKPEKPADLEKLIKALEEAMKGTKPPQGVAQLVKTIKQGTQAQKASGKDLGPVPGLAVLPMAIILFMILDLLRRAWKK
jgi:hypothetical protein